MTKIDVHNFSDAEKEKFAFKLMDVLYDIFDYSKMSNHAASNIYEYVNKHINERPLGYYYSPGAILEELQYNPKEFNEFCEFLAIYARSFRENAPKLMNAFDRFEEILK